MNHGGLQTSFCLCLGFVSALAQLGYGGPQQTPASNGPCDFSGLHLEAMIDTFINQLPPEHTDTEFDRYEVFPGVYIGDFALYSGFHKLRPFGPVLTYCRGGSRFVQIDLAMSEGNFRVTLPWTSGGEARGAIGTIARVKITTTFEVRNISHKNESGTLQPKLILHDGPLPILVENAYAFVERTGTFLDSALPIIGMLFSGLTKDAWLYLAKPAIQEIFRNITLS